MRRLYERSDEWLRDRTRGQYATILGASAGTGVLVVGLLLSRELFVVQAVTMAVVMFVLEYAFGRFQSTDE